ncbi:Uncharacterised protein [Vibrio cholerae]|nr:Uncharacterised protein [Vibrio cholerae]
MNAANTAAASSRKGIWYSVCYKLPNIQLITFCYLHLTLTIQLPRIAAP